MINWLRSFGVLVFGLISCTLGAQNFTISGKMLDGDSSKALSRGSISIAPASDTAKRRLLAADNQGNFTISEVKNGNYFLVFTFTGYDKAEKNVEVSNANVDLGEVLMFRSQHATLGDVTLVGKAPPARQKGDTTELNAAAFKVNPDATVEDLIKKAPGITVENGQVTAQGEQVKKVTIDGRNFFGDDATAALKNLPAEIVDKIQVFDRLSDQAQLTGVDDGNSVKAINIVTKANMRNGQFGRLYAGYGTDDRYAAGGSVNIFSGNKRINLIGLFNNVNQQNFSGEDLLGVSGAASSGRGGRGGGGPRGGGGGWGGGNSFQIGAQPGIAKTNAIGVNYSDLWLNKKIEVSGSYFFNNSNTRAKSTTNRELFMPGDTSQFYKEISSSLVKNYNHRANLRLEYKIDSNNTLILAPSISFQENNSISTLDGTNSSNSGEFINRSANNRVSNNQGYNVRNELTYRHSFAKRGRAFSASLNTSFNKRDGEVELNAISSYVKTGTYAIDTVKQQTNSLNNGYSVSPNVTWMEPVGKNGQLQFSYNPSFNKNNADQENYYFDKTKGDYTKFDTTQSNLFENTTNTHRAGVNYRLGDRENQFVVGVNYQSTTLNSEQQFPLQATVHKTFNNWLPSLQWRKNFDKQSNLRLFYRTSINTPSVNQLQNVLNIANPLFVTTGNPYLENSYTHFLAGRYSKTNTNKGTSFFAGLYLQTASDYVTNATYIPTADSVLTKDFTLGKGAQLSKPVNLDGYRSLRSFMSYGIMLKPIKMNLNLNAGFNYGRTPGQVNYIDNFTNSYTYTLGVTLASNISEYIDFNLNYSGNFSDVNSSNNSQATNKYYYHVAGAKINLLTKNGWFLLNEVTNQTYSGLADGFNQRFWLWNASVGKKFLKNQRGEVKLTVFDLLKQNQSISRNVGESYIEDVQTDVLQQYFMLTFTYSLRNFGKPAARQSGNDGFRRNYGQ